MFGLTITDSGMHAVLAKGTHEQGTVRKYYSADASKEAVTNGVLNEEKASMDLQKIKKEVGGSPVTVCISPQYVYTTTISIPSAEKEQYDELLKEGIQQAIPEEVFLLQYTTRLLEVDEKEKRIGVIAVKKDILESYKHICQNMDIQLKAITTLPLLIAPKEKGRCICIIGTNAFAPTATLYENGWPIDELLLSPKTSNKAIGKEAQAFYEEVNQLRRVDRIYTLGSLDLHTSVEQSFMQSANKRDDGTAKAPVKILRLFQWIKEKDMPRITSIVASLAKERDLHLLSTTNVHAKRGIIAVVVVLLLVCAAMFAYFFF